MAPKPISASVLEFISMLVAILVLLEASGSAACAELADKLRPHNTSNPFKQTFILVIPLQIEN